MGTLAEIETAVHQLALPEQELLLRHLEKLVHRRRIVSESSARERWMERLDNLRSSIGTGTQRLTTEQILAESREERD